MKTIYKVNVSFSFHEDDMLRMMEKPKVDDIDSYILRLRYHHLTLLREYDDLLCLNHLRNVENYWYQIETVKKVLKQFRGRVLLSDEVGLGKTIEACMLIKEYFLRGMIKKVLILTPTSLVSQWKEELMDKFGLDFAATDDPLFRKSGDDFWSMERVIASINIAKSKGNFDRLTNIDYDLVVVDEAHHLKNRKTLNWKLVNSLKKRFIFLLSATPVQNNLIELYNIITLLKPGQFKTESHFKKEYIKRGNSRVPLNKDKLRGLLRDVMIRNTRSLVDIRLPKRFATTINIEPSDHEMRIYNSVSNFIRRCYNNGAGIDKFTLKILQQEAGSCHLTLRDSLKRLLDKRKADIKREVMAEMIKIIDLVEQVDNTEKGKRLIKLIKMKDGKKIIFTNYIKTQDYISSILNHQGIQFSLFNGSMTNSEKVKSINRFREDVDILLSTESGGEGQNIQFCNTMINYDLPWNPMRIEQRIGRIHRIGQTRDVFIFNLAMENSVEDYILKILDSKINMFELVIGEIDSILGNFDSESDFSDIVMDIWTRSEGLSELDKGFDILGEKMIDAKKEYIETCKLDHALFSEDYEV